MKSYKELKGNELDHSYQPSDFRFVSTNDIKETNDFLGQEEAVEAIRQAIKIEDKRYHIYVCSESYQRMDEIIIKTICKAAHTKKASKALGYLYNFRQPQEPTLIELDINMAIALRDDLEEFSATIQHDLPIQLESETVKKEQRRIIESFEDLKAKRLLEVSEKAKENGLQLKITEEGVKFIPLDSEGKPMPLKKYEILSEIELELLNGRLEMMQLMAEETIDKIQQQEEYYYELYEEVKQKTVLKELGGLIRKLQNKYADDAKIQGYLNDLAEDLLKNISILSISETESKEAKKELMPWVIGNGKEKLIEKYGFNLITEPSERGAPVINDLDYLFMNLSGKILVEVEGSTVNSHFYDIKPGLFHLANHGYLILHMQQLLEKQGAWQSLKRMLRSGKIYVENGEEANLSFVNHLIPQGAEADVKIILIGSQGLYELLENYDEEFKHFFKTKINLCEEIKSTPAHIERLAQVIKKIAKQEKLPTVTIDGLLKMVAYSCRKLGTPEKFQADIEVFIDLLKEARVYDKKVADAACIEKVIEARERNGRLLQGYLEDTILDATYLLDTEGEKIGQVNGIAIYSIGDVSFGRPIKITATTYRGKLGIVDIDGTAQLGGAIHTKGVHIIAGFLGYQFAQDFPLSLNCNLCFEQNYTAIDGDSASSAELYALISSLAQLPIKQYFAVTGSMNQFGNIQPIGGVNEKIEGFYKICSLRGLKGNEGVIIPKQNSKDLMLNKEVIHAVELGKFHIFEVSTVWDAMEILMGYDRKDIFQRTYEKLKKYSV